MPIDRDYRNRGGYHPRFLGDVVVASRVFLARLLMVHGEDAPEVLWRMADELEWLEAEHAAESSGGGLDPPN